LTDPSLNWGDDDRFAGPKQTILGMPTNGSFADFVKVPAENVYP
jgi:hypothetical protein